MQETEDGLAVLVGQRAENLFLTRQLLCSEAVLVALNEGFRGGLAQDMAIRIASALPEGLGGSGCLCGAVSGAVLGIGLFLGRDRPAGRVSRAAWSAAREFHDRFKEACGSTCCRVLTKNVIGDDDARFKQCARQTGKAAELAAAIILKRRPELASQADHRFLARRDSRLIAALKRAYHYLFS